MLQASETPAAHRRRYFVARTIFRGVSELSEQHRYLHRGKGLTGSVAWGASACGTGSIERAFSVDARHLKLMTQCRYRTSNP